MYNSKQHQSFLATSSRKYFKYGLGTSLLLAIIAFNIPIYSNIPKTVFIDEEEVFEIEYLVDYVPEKKVEKKVEQKIEPKKLPTVVTPEPIKPKPIDPTPIEPIVPANKKVVLVDPAPVVTTPPPARDFAEVMPSFKGGETAMLAYFAKETHYPQQAIEWGIDGKVLVRFIVDEEGKVIEAEVVQSVHPLLDKEALRVVKSMPAWDPGMQNGKHVKVYMVAPITFVLK